MDSKILDEFQAAFSQELDLLGHNLGALETGPAANLAQSRMGPTLVQKPTGRMKSLPTNMTCTSCLAVRPVFQRPLSTITRFYLCVIHSSTRRVPTAHTVSATVVAVANRRGHGRGRRCHRGQLIDSVAGGPVAFTLKGNSYKCTA